MPRKASNARRTINPWWVRGLIALGVASFFVGVMAHATQSSVLSAGYYQDVLDDEEAYERAFAELSRDPALLGISSDLLGGVELPIIDQVPGLLVNAIPVQLVEAMMDDAIADFIEYLKDNQDFSPRLDITPFVDGVGSPGLNTAIEALGGIGGIGEDGGGVLPIPEDFEEGIDDILDGFLDEGRRLPALPALPGERQGAALPSMSSGGLLARTGTDPGVTVGFPAADFPGVLFDIKDSKYVQEVEIDGETRYFLSPPAETVKKIEDSLFWMHLLASNSEWLRPVGIGLFVAALGGLIWVSRGDRRGMARRLGIMFAIAGLFTFTVWLIAIPIVQGRVIDAAFEGSTIPSESFDILARDILERAVLNLSPYVWLPALTLAGIGAGLLVAARFGGRPRRAASA